MFTPPPPYLVLSSDCERARLGDQVLIDRNILAGLLTIPALLDSTERRLGSRRVSSVLKRQENIMISMIVLLLLLYCRSTVLGDTKIR